MKIELDDQIIEQLDTWRRFQPTLYSRVQAIQYLIKKALEPYTDRIKEEERTSGREAD
jgi:hypothetical protein